MSDKIRGSLFNVLGDVSGLCLLDAFSGSGALSLEAASRGAAKVIAVDIDKKAYETILQNVKKLNVEDNIKVTRANIVGWSSNNLNTLFDIVLLDPPFDNLRISTVEKIATHVKPEGLLVLNWLSSNAIPNLPSLNLVTVKRYGNDQLIFYRRI